MYLYILFDRHFFLQSDKRRGVIILNLLPKLQYVILHVLLYLDKDIQLQYKGNGGYYVNISLNFFRKKVFVLDHSPKINIHPHVVPILFDPLF